MSFPENRKWAKPIPTTAAAHVPVSPVRLDWAKASRIFDFSSYK
jgi:hypothetical protein